MFYQRVGVYVRRACLVGVASVALSALGWAAPQSTGTGSVLPVADQLIADYQQAYDFYHQLDLACFPHEAAVSSRYSVYRYTRGFPRRMPATGRKVFVFDPQRLRFAIYSPSGHRVREGKAVGGSHYCRDVGRACRTPRGIFRVYTRRGASCFSSVYPRPYGGGARMPWCHFFRGGYAIHGSYELPNYNASHGCIRVHPRMARWLYHNYLTIGTVVVVRNY